jgi:recombination protein RecA
MSNIPFGAHKKEEVKIEVASPVIIPDSTKEPEANVFIPRENFLQKIKKTREVKDDTSSKTFSQIANKFASDFTANTKLEFWSTGSPSFDNILGGGIAKGKMYTLHSPAGLGKTTCCLSFCRSICEKGGTCIYLDVEHAVNSTLIKGVGLEPYYNKSFIVHDPDTFSEAETIMDTYLKCSEPPSLIVIDSITMMISEKLKNGEMLSEDVEPGWHARLASLFLNKFKHKIPDTGSSIFLINQERTKIRFRGPSTVEAAGGAALQFIPDVIIEMKHSKDIMQGEVCLGSDTLIETTKNKVTIPFIRNLVSIIFGEGISNSRSFSYLLEADGAVKQLGSMFNLTTPSGLSASCRGRNALEEYIKQNEFAVVEYLKSRGRL